MLSSKSVFSLSSSQPHQCSHKAVYKRERGMSGREGDAMPEAEVWVGSHMSVYSQECLGKGRGRERGWGGESAC